MRKELEALEIIKIATTAYEAYANNEALQESVKIIEKALTTPTEKETLYFDAKKSVGFKVNFNIIHFHLKEQLFDCHGLTKSETKERGYNWPSNMFTTEKPKPLKIIDGRVE